MNSLVLRLSAFSVAAIVSGGCAGRASAPEHKIQIADEAMVAGCRYIDNVHGTSGLYGVFAKRGFENAKSDAMQEAQQLGATHIVWIPTAQGYGSSQAEAKAYKCGS